MPRQLMKISVVMVVMLLVVMLLAALVPGAVGASGTQTWWLTSLDKPVGAPTAVDPGGPPRVFDNLMRKGGEGGPEVSFGLTWASPAAWFYADTGAEVELGFGEHNWTAHIRTGAIGDDIAGTTLEVRIYRVVSGEGATRLAEGALTLALGADRRVWEIPVVDQPGFQDFAVGEWLAMRLRWVGAAEGQTLKVYYGVSLNDDSRITSPPTDPGYPIPELSTIILFSMGLLLLGGYAWLKRKQKFSRAPA